MSQYHARLNITVTSPEIWAKFADKDDAGLSLADLADTEATSFIRDYEWAINEMRLIRIVHLLAETLGNDGIIIADITNCNVDTYTYCVFYLGGSIRTGEFFSTRNDERCQMCEEARIDNIPEWLSYGKFTVIKKEKDQLLRLGIVSMGRHFAKIITDIELPAKIYLRETGFEERPKSIENSGIGEAVYLVHAKSKYDPMRMEVFSEHGSLGYLPSDVSGAIAPLYKSDRLAYTAKIVDMVKLSQRNKHAKSPILAVSIDAHVKSPN